jgi:microcystin-dependent protein
MSNPFIGEIVMFGGNFAPRSWALCNGQLLDIASNTALFSILGTTYGGDGRVTFALPDMRGRVSVHPGTGPGLSPRRLGEKGGSETNTLTVPNLPSHTHPLLDNAVDDDPNTTNVQGNALANGGSYSSATPDASTKPTTTGGTGGNTAVNNIQPYLCVNYLIALVGVFPSRN